MPSLDTTPGADALRARLAANLCAVNGRIAAAAARAGRKADEVRMVAVTKSASLAETALLHELGAEHLGENRIESAEAKIAAMPDSAVWHMIGNVQRRKARKVVELFSMIDTVDRLELAEALQRRCEELDATRQVLLEFNVSGEENKHGATPAEAGEMLRQMRAFDRLIVRGVMTMAPFDAPEPVLRQVFGGLHRIAQEHGLRDISMGMTDDYEIAIEEGATEVRIGRALFV